MSCFFGFDHDLIWTSHGVHILLLALLGLGFKVCYMMLQGNKHAKWQDVLATVMQVEYV